ncbi:hypothetical protein EMPS_06542 [Entomortierella parvispora]|uniref:Uncharacterized protein n=1 Tax=Entomortierella parvispora TaxID=205924 RepID=A0A9P3LXI9_9FUNG|nr:hypothetical protein EMPS_06542 [Entomortierella parvispora]
MATRKPRAKSARIEPMDMESSSLQVTVQRKEQQPQPPLSRQQPPLEQQQLPQPSESPPKQQLPQQHQTHQPPQILSPPPKPITPLPQEQECQLLSASAGKLATDIPEILLMIMQHWSHSKRTLARLRLVSRSFRDAADRYFRIPLRIEDVKYGAERFPRLERLRAVHLLQCPHLISVLRVVDIPVAEDNCGIPFDFIATNCTELKSLSIFPRFKVKGEQIYARVDHPYQQNLIQQLLLGSMARSLSGTDTATSTEVSQPSSGPVPEQFGLPSPKDACYRLKELIVGGPIPEWDIYPLLGAPFPASDLCRVPESLLGLEVLSIKGLRDWKSREFTMFCQHFPQLSQFALCIWRPEHITADQRSTIMACSNETSTSTTTTTLMSIPKAPSYPTPQRLGIKTLQLSGMTSFGTDDIRRLLDSFPDLEELDIRFSQQRSISCIEKSSAKVAPVFTGLKRLSIKYTSPITLRTIGPCLVDLEELSLICSGYLLDRRTSYIVDAFKKRQTQLAESPKRFLKKLELSHATNETSWNTVNKFVKRAGLALLLSKMDQFHYLETLVLGAKLSLFMKVTKPVKAFRVAEYRFPPCFQTLRVLELKAPEEHERGRVPDDVQDEFWKEYLPRMPRLQTLAIHDVWGLDRFPFRCGMKQSPLEPSACWFAKIEKVNGVQQCACLMHTVSTDISKTEPAPSCRYMAVNRKTTNTETLPTPIMPALPLPIPRLTKLTLHLYGQLKRPIMERWPVAFFDWIDTHFPEMEALHLRCTDFAVEIRNAMRVEAKKKWPDMDFVMDE